MTNTVIGALRVNLGLDAASFDNGLTKSERRLDAFGRSAKDSSGTAVRAFEVMGAAAGAFGKTFIAGLTIGGLAGAVTSVMEVARGVAQVGTEAQKAGVNIKAFQELKFAAEQNRVGVDALVDGLKELNLRADEFIVTGGGSAAEAFKRLGYDAISLKEKLKDPSALFSEIIGKLGEFDKAAQIRIMDEVFGGTGGEQFVQFLAQGERGLRDNIRAANDLGVVMDAQLIEKAAELDRRFNAIAATVGSALKGAIVSAADSLSEFIDGFRSYQNQLSSTLEKKQAEIGAKRIDIENEILAKQAEQRAGLEKLSDVANNLGFENSRNAQLAGKTGEIEALKEQMRELNEEDAKITNTLGDRLQPMVRSGDRTWTPPVVTPGAASSGSGATARDKGAASADRERESVQRLIAQLQEELSLVGASDQQKRAATASRQAGAAATDAERQQVVALNESLYQSEQAQQRATEAAAFFQDAAYDAFSDLIPQIETGNKALDTFVNSLIEAVAQSALLGKGPFAGSGGSGILGGIGAFFGLKLAGGGGVRGPGGPRADKIPAMLSNGEFVVNSKATSQFRPLLEAINAGALKMPSFKMGGLADLPSGSSGSDMMIRRKFR